MSQDTWKEVRDKVEGLGLKLKLHLEQENDEADTTSSPGDTKAAVEDLGQKLQDAFASFGNAAKDPAVQSDMKDIGASLKDAMLETFSAVGAKVDETVTEVKNRKVGGGDAGDDLTPPKPADGA